MASPRMTVRSQAVAARSSLDRSEELLPVTPARAWIALCGFAAVLGAVVTWAVLARVPTRAEGQAVILRAGGVRSVIASGSGIITGLTVGPGDKVRARQVIAKISQPVLTERLVSAESALDAARRERERAVSVRQQAATLETASVERQRDSIQREIADFEGRAKLAAQRIRMEEELFASGIVARQQVIDATQKRDDIIANINRLRAQLTQFDAQRYTIEAAPAQTAAEHDARVREAERQLSEVKKQLAVVETVTAPYGGQVVEVKTYQGATITQGAPILNLQADQNELEAIAYVPSSEAKNVKPGLDVDLALSNVKREEFGYLRGTVRWVAEYPASPAALMRNFENETLVQSLTRSGAVTEVRVALERDAATPSGFRWTSSKGPEAKLTPGSLGTVRIVTRRQAPLALILPYLRAKGGW